MNNGTHTVEGGGEEYDARQGPAHNQQTERVHKVVTPGEMLTRWDGTQQSSGRLESAITREQSQHTKGNQQESWKKDDTNGDSVAVFKVENNNTMHHYA